MADEIKKLQIKIGADAAEATKAFRDVTQEAQQTASGLDQITQATDKLGVSATDVAGKLKGALAGFAVFETLKNIAQLSDAYASLEARISLVTGSAETTQEVLSEIGRIAQESATPLESVGTLYARLAQASKEAGTSQQDLLTFTQGIADSMRVAGTSAQEASGGLLQLSQAIAAGALRGEEFNSVSESMPLVLDAIAKSLGVTRGELKDLAKEGQITSQVMIEAVNSMSEVWREQAAAMPLRLEDALTNLRSAWTEYVGQTSEVRDASGLVAQSLQLVADNLERIDGIVGSVAIGALAAVFTKTALNINQMVTAQRAASVAAKEQTIASEAAARAALQNAQASEASAKASFNHAQAKLASAKATLEAVRAEAAQAPYLARLESYHARLAVAERARNASLRELTAASTRYTQAQNGMVAAQNAAGVAAQTLGSKILAAVNPMNLFVTATTLLMSYDIGTWLREAAVNFEQSAAQGNLFAEALRLIGLGATDAEAATRAIAENSTKLAERLKKVSETTGVTVTSMEQFNKYVEANVIVFNEATGVWERGAGEIEKVGVAVKSAAAEFGDAIKTLGVDISEVTTGLSEKFAEMVTAFETVSQSTSASSDLIAASLDKIVEKAKSLDELLKAQELVSKAFAEGKINVVEYEQKMSDLSAKMDQTKDGAKELAAGMKEVDSEIRKAADAIELLAVKADLRRMWEEGKLSTEEYLKKLREVLARLDEVKKKHSEVGDSAEEGWGRASAAAERAADAAASAATAAGRAADAAERVAEGVTIHGEEIGNAYTNPVAVIQEMFRSAGLDDIAAEMVRNLTIQGKTTQQWFRLLHYYEDLAKRADEIVAQRKAADERQAKYQEDLYRKGLEDLERRKREYLDNLGRPTFTGPYPVPELEAVPPSTIKALETVAKTGALITKNTEETNAEIAKLDSRLRALASRQFQVNLKFNATGLSSDLLQQLVKGVRAA